MSLRSLRTTSMAARVRKGLVVGEGSFGGLRQR